MEIMEASIKPHLCQPTQALVVREGIYIHALTFIIWDRFLIVLSQASEQLWPWAPSNRLVFAKPQPQSGLGSRLLWWCPVFVCEVRSTCIMPISQDQIGNSLKASYEFLDCLNICLIRISLVFPEQARSRRSTENSALYSIPHTPNSTLLNNVRQSFLLFAEQEQRRQVSSNAPST